MRSPDNGLRSNCWTACLFDQPHNLCQLLIATLLGTRFVAGFFSFRVDWTVGIPRGRAGLERQRALQARRQR